MYRLSQKRNIVEYLKETLEKKVKVYKFKSQSSPGTRGNWWQIAFIIFFAFFSRREKQSLERYLKEVPTVEEHQKLNKTISLKLGKFHLNFLDIIIKKTRRYLLNISYFKRLKVFQRTCKLSYTTCSRH